MILAIAGLLTAAIALPYLLDLERVRPGTAVSFWGSALALRAMTVVFGLAYLVFVLPRTEIFAALTHWCWHTIMPLITTHLDGHSLGHATVIGASFVVAMSAISVGFGLARATRAVRRLLAGASLGVGPNESLIVGGSDVLLAAAGFARPQIIVSAGALAVLDDEELAAGLDHERGHIARRHRFLLVLAEICRGIARFLPGTRHSVEQLMFHVERDADHWALSRRHDRLALASAICKAATPRGAASPVLSTLGGSGVRRRLEQLLDGTAQRADALTSPVVRIASVGMVAFTLAAAAAGSTATVAVAQKVDSGHQLRHCD